jgi:hypothetical protein
MGFSMEEASIIHEDNDSAAKIAQSYKKHPGVKHIQICHHFIRDRVLEVKDITIEQVADLLPKQLPYPAFKRHRDAGSCLCLSGCVEEQLKSREK